MPRPGPRPYECVRRAWHSDRHQPMRGSLIQEIFRVANEVHSPATRQNKEWQEKLPFVVLKAEEIMYSKANSEAEYMDPKTLWDRANDAVDTIIRKDDTTESGDLLQPCIEAALNLGCIPRRASRSQRHSNPGCYLSSSMKDATAASFKAPDNNKAHLGSSPCLLPATPTDLIDLQISASQFPSWHPAFSKPSNVIAGITGVKSVKPDTSQGPGVSFTFHNREFHHLSQHSLLSCQDRTQIPRDTNTRPGFGRVYPLYYSDGQEKAGIQVSLQIPQDLAENMLTATVPVLNLGKTDVGFVRKLLATKNSVDASNRVSNFVETSANLPNMKCDLSLRLRPPSPLSPQSARTNEVEDVGSSSSYNSSKFGDQSPSRARAQDSESLSSPSKGRCFGLFPVELIDEPLESCSSKWSSEGEGTLYVEATYRKRKLPTGPFDEEHLCWKQKT